MQCYPFKRILIKMLAHIHIFVAQHCKNFSFAFSSKPMLLKVWLNQYSLTFLGQDALQSEHDSVCQILKPHNFVYNYRKCWTSWKPGMKPQGKNPWFTVGRPNKVKRSPPLLPLLKTFQDKEMGGWFDYIMFVQTSLIGKRHYFLVTW